MDLLNLFQSRIEPVKVGSHETFIKSLDTDEFLEFHDFIRKNERKDLTLGAVLLCFCWCDADGRRLYKPTGETLDKLQNLMGSANIVLQNKALQLNRMDDPATDEIKKNSTTHESGASSVSPDLTDVQLICSLQDATNSPPISGDTPK